MMKDSLILNYFLFKDKQSSLRDSLILNNRAEKLFNVKQSGSLPNDRLARYPDTPGRWGIQAPHARKTPPSGNEQDTPTSGNGGPRGNKRPPVEIRKTNR